MTFKKIIIICGHYGSGKTNFAMNLAMDLHKNGQKITIVDLDVINPYFRTSDYAEMLENKSIHVICPPFAGTTLDTPALSAEIYSIFEQKEGHVIIDVGGDDAGAAALGQFARLILKENDFEMLYIVNKFRKLVGTPPEAVEIMHEIEGACHIKATAIVNNSHLSNLTSVDDILSSVDYAEETSRISKLPLKITTTPKKFYNELSDRIKNLYPIDIIVTPPWVDNGY